MDNCISKAFDFFDCDVNEVHYSNFFSQKDSKFTAIRTPCEASEFLIDLFIYPFQDIQYVYRKDRWMHSVVYCSRTIDTATYGEYFNYFSRVKSAVKDYIKSHPKAQTGPFIKQEKYFPWEQDYSDEPSYVSELYPSDNGILVNWFERDMYGVSKWMRAPAPMCSQIIEISIYPYEIVAGIPLKHRWNSQQVDNFTYPINATGDSYQMILNIVKDTHSYITSSPHVEEFNCDCFWHKRY